MSYRFNKEHHIHQIEIDGVWRDLIGTSSVMGILAKPLTYWAAGLAVGKLGWLNPKFHSQEERLAVASRFLEDTKNIAPVAYIDLLDEAYKAHAVKLQDSAEAGTDRHALVERFVKGRMNGQEVIHRDIQPFIDWADKNVKRFIWSEAHCYNEDLWIGGISDIGAELNNGAVGIIDIKSSKEAYKSQFFQIGGYDLQISKNGLFTYKGEKVNDPIKIDFHAVFPFGATKPDMVIEYDTEENKRSFESALQIYKILNKNGSI